MLFAKPRSPVSAVAKHSLARGAMSWTIWSIARPSSAPTPVGSSSITVTPSGGRSPVRTSSAAWTVSGPPPTASVAVSKESESAPTVTPRPSIPRGTWSTRSVVTPCEVAAPTFVYGFSACETLATPAALAIAFTSSSATKPSSAFSELSTVCVCRPAASASPRTAVNDACGCA